MSLENRPDYIQPTQKPKKPFSNDEIRKTKQEPSPEQPNKGNNPVNR